MSRRRPWDELLPRFSVDRRVTVMVLVATALVVGVVAAVGIPLELIPRGFEAPRLMVVAPWRDAPPREVLEKVVTPLEEELSTVGGLDEVSSVSSVGFARVFLSFDQGTDMDIAYREVRDRILRARPRLPDDLEKVLIRKHDEASVPVMVVGVAIDPRVPDPYQLIQQEIIAPLSRVDGVAAVNSQGLEEKEVFIELDRERTDAAGLNIYQVAQELSGDNFSLASGDVEEGGRKLLLRAISRWDDLEEIENQLVAPGVRLSDIGRVRYQAPEQDWRVRVNGKPALAIQVLKEGQANTVEVGRRLEKAFDEIKENPRLQGSFLEVLFSQSDVILESLGTLVDSGRIGAIFAVLILLFFLRRFRLTLIITMAIPMSMVIALVVMYFAGETLNVLTLLGLIISVGLLVDNSVVVAENIHRLHRDGLPRRRACIRGAGEIALAVTLATLTTIIVFLPVSLVEGRAQFFLLRLAIPITVSLAASLVVALTFVPLCIYFTLGRRRARDPRPVAWTHRVMDGVIGRLYLYTMEPLSAGYTRLLRFFLRHRLDLVLLLLAVLAATGAAMSSVDVVQVSEEDRRNFDIKVNLPPGYSIEDAEDHFADIEKVLEKIKKEVGLEGYFVLHTRSWGEVQGWFPPDSNISRREVTEEVLDRLPKRPGVEYFSGERSEKDERERFVYSVTLSGEDPDVLAGVAERLEERIRGVEGVVGVRRNGQPRPNEIGLAVDRERAERLGASPRLVAGVVGYALRGQPLPRLHRNGREVPVRIRFEEEDRQGLTELDDFAVPTASGKFVKLSSVTDPTFLSAPREIFRRDKRISHVITVDLAEKDTEATRRRLDALVSKIDLPEGVRFGASRFNTELDDEMASMRYAALVSILFIYLLMGFLFESFILPLSIILTLPLASIGVVWGHVITGRDLDFLGMVGVVLLIGVVVNNGIVLIDYVGRLRREGHERAEAILLAARRRFRPIMMTAGTTIAGMVPLTLGEPTSIGLSYRSFGITLIGGLGTATMLTLLVVPVFYTLFDDARDRVLGALRGALRGRRSARG